MVGVKKGCCGRTITDAEERGHYILMRYLYKYYHFDSEDESFALFVFHILFKKMFLIFSLFFKDNVWMDGWIAVWPLLSSYDGRRGRGEERSDFCPPLPLSASWNLLIANLSLYLSASPVPTSVAWIPAGTMQGHRGR